MFDEALGIEGTRVGENGSVVMSEYRCHTDGRHSGDVVAAVLKHSLGKEPLQAVGDTVTDPKALCYYSGEVRELLQLRPFGLSVRLGHDLADFCLESRAY